MPTAVIDSAGLLIVEIIEHLRQHVTKWESALNHLFLLVHEKNQDYPQAKEDSFLSNPGIAHLVRWHLLLGISILAAHDKEKRAEPERTAPSRHELM
mmetsp:Transcript_41727/g.89587  ORF Transcript_41727/g.89587 Transcript_41727/m.89587 type:complete len:97 (-) Transcript_41727:115-405(-)|eukprot:CAMPEP_0206482096 /NCGR_PEP_ID=MMETSP0324_2-20121206/38648_1 /ASSEMBLY_ACC=CAM_ASM_000836 /TAXON_ID=2866 /ORGANISM="Crypthecodinium cohnii, Strain Seligo" /LENGTH=96 /DNA_ID=CAMNT_0053959933 /DNA_START=87 /DNA_END=377 /DNA_ORIENTATION=-